MIKGRAIGHISFVVSLIFAYLIMLNDIEETSYNKMETT
jgi:hypothetical protein